MKIYKNNFNFSKYKLSRLVPFVTTLSLVLCGCSKEAETKKIDKTTDIKGYYRNLDDVKEKITSNEFVILNINDYNSLTDNELIDDINWCNKKNIAVGLIYENNPQTLSDIYLDVDYLKQFIKENKITWPIYLNIDNIFNNDLVSLDNKRVMIETFINKMINNGISIGVYGNSKNLNYINNIIDTIDDFAVLNSDDINTKTNKIISKTDYENIILNRNLNKEENFIEDGYYIYNESDNVDSIANRYNITKLELETFNDIESLTDKDIIRIPSTYQTRQHSSIKPEVANYIKKGIDISSYQGNIDFKKISESNIDFVIIRLTDFYNKDENNNYTIDQKFFYNIESCKYYNIPVGVYCVSNAYTVEDIISEAYFAAYHLERYNIEYPIYIDLEPRHCEELVNSSCDIDNILKNWNNIMLEFGHRAGIYTNRTSYNKLNDYCTTNLDSYNNWIAYGEYWNTKTTLDNVEEIASSFENYGYNMCQITQNGYIEGINSPVDINLLYSNYTDNNKYKYDFEEKTIASDKIKLKEIIASSLIALSTCGIITTTKKVLRKKM